MWKIKETDSEIAEKEGQNEFVRSKHTYFEAFRRSLICNHTTLHHVKVTRKDMIAIQMTSSETYLKG